MEPLSLQQQLFYQIKAKLTPQDNMAKAIAETLNVTVDAAYKKIKSERLLDLKELEILLNAFKISLTDIDSRLHMGKVTFNFNPINETNFTLKDYLRQMVSSLQMLVNNDVKYIIYSAKEVPMFYNFMFPELGCFKSFVWQKSILNLKSHQGLKFSTQKLDEEVVELGGKIYELYNKIYSKEIWNYETVNCTIRQIDFYKVAGLFEDSESYQVIINQYYQLLKHIEEQTNLGKKVNIKTNETCANFDLYHNELIIGDNTVLVEFENSQIAFITPNAVNSFSTTQPEVTTYISDNFSSLIQKSIRLNKQNEKIKTPFFERIKRGIEEL
jgi:hypothetical protein